MERLEIFMMYSLDSREPTLTLLYVCCVEDTTCSKGDQNTPSIRYKLKILATLGHKKLTKLWRSVARILSLYQIERVKWFPDLWVVANNKM